MVNLDIWRQFQEFIYAICLLNGRPVDGIASPIVEQNLKFVCSDNLYIYRDFVTISGFQREVLVKILDFPIHSIHFLFSLSSS